MAVARTATISGVQTAGSSASLATSGATCNTSTNGTDHYAVALVNISVDTNSASTTCAVTYGGVSMTQQSLVLLGSGTARAAIGLYTLNNPSTGSQSVVATSGGASIKRAIAVGGAVYSGVGSLSSVVAAATTGLTVDGNTAGGMVNGKIIVGTTNGAALSSPNRNSLYLVASSPTGVGDSLSVQDADGAASVAFTNSGTSSTPESLGIALLPVPALFDTLTDTFGSADTAKWDFNGTASVSGGQAVLVPNISYSAEVNGFAKAFYNLDESSIYIEMASIPNVGNGTTECTFELRINTSNKLAFIYAGGNLLFRETVATVNSTTSVTYSSTDHRWLRFRETGGTLYWDTAPTHGSGYGPGTWVNRRNKAPGIAITRLFCLLNSGFYGTEPSPGSALFDNVNNTPSALTPGRGFFALMGGQ